MASSECMLCEETLDADVCAHASVVVCASRCCCGVTGLSRALCAALSYVKLHLRPRLCLALLSVLSRGPAPPRPICRVLLIVDHNAVTPRPFPTTGKLIVLLPSHSRPAIQPMREQHGGFLLASPTKSFRLKKTHTRTHKHTHTTHPMISMTASDNNTHFVEGHTANTHISFTARVGADSNFFHPGNSSGVGCQWQRSAWRWQPVKGIFDLKDVQGPDRVERGREREMGGEAEGEHI